MLVISQDEGFEWHLGERGDTPSLSKTAHTEHCNHNNILNGIEDGMRLSSAEQPTVMLVMCS